MALFLTADRRAARASAAIPMMASAAQTRAKNFMLHQRKTYRAQRKIEKVRTVSRPSSRYPKRPLYKTSPISQER
ncbi:hypothetical protein CALVIDRAFT_194432 [Calocera viscosa TUFC12733]|uniref:Uncharacterized protein n=1 Tax=Calocera viscosa (strain TUFC12733) TaxID=1330018 RepID=A0A167KS07_CALVF|nr:hypothetical protein CALVIDRAFT_194432 [Calocera viscosa TUFC12733]